MTTPDPTNPAQPSNQPPPVQQPHVDQQRPVVIQNSTDQDTLRAFQSQLTDFGNKLAGLPESIVNSFREATGTPAAPPSQTPATQPPATPPATPATSDTPPAAKRGNKFHSFWFGGE